MEETVGDGGRTLFADGRLVREAASGGSVVGSPKLLRSETDRPNLCLSNEITSEVSDYVQACINSGIDPDEPAAGPKALRRGEGPDVFERYWGSDARP